MRIAGTWAQAPRPPGRIATSTTRQCDERWRFLVRRLHINPHYICVSVAFRALAKLASMRVAVVRRRIRSAQTLGGLPIGAPTNEDDRAGRRFGRRGEAMVMNWLALAIFGFLLCISPSDAGVLADHVRERPQAPRVEVGWQTPDSLPPRFRNHCRVDGWHAPYCSDHCGWGHQFYYCSDASFGCCHVGRGYCDWRGSLRCAPF